MAYHLSRFEYNDGIFVTIADISFDRFVDETNKDAKSFWKYTLGDMPDRNALDGFLKQAERNDIRGFFNTIVEPWIPPIGVPAIYSQARELKDGNVYHTQQRGWYGFLKGDGKKIHYMLSNFEQIAQPKSVGSRS